MPTCESRKIYRSRVVDAATMRKELILAIAAATAACTTKPQPAPVATPVAAAPKPVAVSADALVDHTGDSPETAVTVPANAPNEGIDFQNNWIFDRYGRFRRAGG